MDQRTTGVAILLMGGVGRRMGSSCPDKTLALIAGKPVFWYPLFTICGSEMFSEIVIAFRDGAQREKIEHWVSGLDLHSSVSYVRGGDSRQESVLNALLSLRRKQPSFALIHDAARPLVSRDNLSQLISALDGNDGAILAHRATDTLVDISDNGRRYLNRDGVWHVETPQVFEYETILNAYLGAKGPLTDDSSALPRESRVKIVENFYPNIKVTHPCDLAIAEALLTKKLAQ